MFQDLGSETPPPSSTPALMREAERSCDGPPQPDRHCSPRPAPPLHQDCPHPACQPKWKEAHPCTISGVTTATRGHWTKWSDCGASWSPSARSPSPAWARNIPRPCSPTRSRPDLLFCLTALPVGWSLTSHWRVDGLLSRGRSFGPSPHGNPLGATIGKPTCHEAGSNRHVAFPSSKGTLRGSPGLSAAGELRSTGIGCMRGSAQDPVSRLNLANIHRPFDFIHSASSLSVVG